MIRLRLIFYIQHVIIAPDLKSSFRRINANSGYFMLVFLCVIPWT